MKHPASKWLLATGALFGVLAVLSGSMGSHMLRDQLEAFNGTANFILASNYLFYHAGGLLFTGLLLERLERRGFLYVGIFFIVGSFLFC